MLRRRVLAALTASTVAVVACSSPEPEHEPVSTHDAAEQTTSPPAPVATSRPAPTEQPAENADPSTAVEENTEESTDEPEDPEEPAESDPPLAEAGVSAGHPAAVEVGTDILTDGGNAVDASVAMALAISVVEPFSSGIGGGGAALVFPGTGDEFDPISYDYREVVANDGEIPATGTGIPGLIAGLEELHSEHGELDWADVVQPSIDLAREGHPVSDIVAEQLRLGHGPQVVADNPQFSSGGQPLAAGDLLVQDDLADTLEVIAEEGPDAFYTGSLVAELTEVDGIDAASLASFEVASGAPVSGRFGDYRVHSAMPALAGVGLIQQLQVAEALGAGSLEPGTADYWYAITQAWEVADESVNTVVGDPASVEVPVDELTDRERNADLAAGLDRPRGGSGATPAIGTPDSPNTTHISVVDADGMTVSMTNTIMRFWGSGEVVGGFFMNDQLTRFDAIGTTDANDPAPGQRSVSWSAPTVVTDGDARPVLVLGSPGGRQIPNILTTVLVQWGLGGRSLQDAVTTPRAHAEDSVLRVESQLDAGAVQELDDYGYSVEVAAAEWHMFGSVQALEVDYETGTVTGAQDDRREGTFEIVGLVDIDEDD